MVRFWIFFSCCCCYHFCHIFLIFLAIPCLLKALGICGKEFWIRAHFFNEIRKYRKDVRSVKWAWSVLHSQLKAHILLPHRHTYLVLCYFHFYLFATYLLKFFSKTLNSKILKFLISSNCLRKETAFSHPMEELTQELQVNLWHSEQTDTCWN